MNQPNSQIYCLHVIFCLLFSLSISLTTIQIVFEGKKAQNGNNSDLLCGGHGEA